MHMTAAPQIKAVTQPNRSVSLLLNTAENSRNRVISLQVLKSPPKGVYRGVAVSPQPEEHPVHKRIASVVARAAVAGATKSW
jgi:carbamate kinase